MALLSNPYTGDDDARDWEDPAEADAAEEPEAWQKLCMLERQAEREAAADQFSAVLRANLDAANRRLWAELEAEEALVGAW